jgi:hypothetical protein
MSIILYVLLFIVYNSKVSSSITLANKPFSTTSSPVVVQIPSPPILSETTSIHSNHKQYKKESDTLSNG